MSHNINRSVQGLLVLFFFAVIMVITSLRFINGEATQCFGFFNTSGLQCVHSLGTCISNNTCLFTPQTYMYVMGRNDKYQLGTTSASSFPYTLFPETHSYGGYGSRIFYISKMASDYTLVTDYNGDPLVTNEGSMGFTSFANASTMKSTNDSPIAILGDDTITGYVTTSNKLFVSGIDNFNSMNSKQSTFVPAEVTYFSNVIDASVTRLGGCAISYSNASVSYDLYFWGLINVALKKAGNIIHDDLINSNSSSLLSDYMAALYTNGNFDLNKCEVVRGENATGNEVPTAFLLKDTGDLFVYGAHSIANGVSNSADARFSDCYFGKCTNTAINILQNVDFFKCSASHCIASVNGSQLFTWGNNTYGQLCLNDYSYRANPTQVSTGFAIQGKVIQVTATKNNIYVLTDAGFVYGCGSNLYGQMGVPPNKAASFNTLSQIVIPNQRRKIFHLADGVDSESLIAFSGLKCTNYYSGFDCSTSLYSCYGVPANSSLTCSGRGSCAMTDACLCATPFNGSDCEMIPPDFSMQVKIVNQTENMLDRSYNSSLKLTGVLYTPNILYSNIMNYVKSTRITIIISGGVNNLTLRFDDFVLIDKLFVDNLPIGYYNVRVLVNFKLIGYSFSTLESSYTFEKSVSHSNVLSFQNSEPYYVSKNGVVRVIANVDDPYFLASSFRQEWKYCVKDSVNCTAYTDGTLFSGISSLSPTRITFEKDALFFISLAQSNGANNVTVELKFSYYRYAKETSSNSITLTVVINLKNYAPSITINRYPSTTYLSPTRPTSVSAVITFSEPIPDALSISYRWSISPPLSVDWSSYQKQSILVFSPDVFNSSTVYSFTVDVSVSYAGDTNNYRSLMTVRSPPTLPQYPPNVTVLSITPSDGSGVALITPHNITVAALNTEDSRSLTYTLRYAISDTEPRVYKQLSQLGRNSLTSSNTLPYGQILVEVLIQDEYGNSLTTDPITIQTRQIDLDTVKALVNSKDMTVIDVETTASTINRLNTQQDTSSLREKLSEILFSKISSQYPDATISDAINSITKKTSDLTKRGANFLVQGAKTISGNLKNIFEFGGEAEHVALSLTDSLSNIADNKNISEVDLNANISSTLSSISRQLASTLLPSQSILLQTTNFNIFVFGNTSIASNNYSIENMSISLPFDFDTYLGKATSNINSPSKSYSVELISYKTSIFDNVRLNNTIGTNSSRASNILSLVIGAAITSGADKSEVIVNNLNTPLVFVFPINNQTSNNFECKFINENTNAWSKEGCTTEILSTGVKCFCNHATKFSIFRLYTESVTNDEFLGNTGIRVVNVIFGCIYFVLSCGVFIGLLFLRNTNPVRSRYIGPYVGLAAIMLDSLIISFIQNIVLLAIDKGTSNTEADVVFIKTTANGFNYFNVILVIPLYLTAFFTFLVQIVRYFIKRHMYEYISNKIIYNAHVYRTITSKSAFWAILSVSLAIIVGYYVIWVGLGGANVFSNPLTFTYITSLSYFGLAWIIGMMLVIIAVWDLFYMNGHLFGSCCIPNDVNVKPTFSSSPSYVQKNRISKLMNILARTKKQKQQLGASLFLSIPQVYYFTDDNLYFRLENHLFILSYVALSINYLAGIADISVISVGIQDSASRLGPAIVGLVSGIAYSFLLIGSFGGLIVLCYLIERRRKKVTPNHQTSRVEEDELLQLLGDRFGKPLFVEFCEKEFSLENIYFYDAVSEVQRTMDSKEDDELRNLVHNMHEKFIKTGCEYEVNLPSTSTKAFNTVYGNPQATAKQIKDMLDTVLISVMYNLKDTYSRFSMTEEYRLYQQSKDNISMLENNFL